MASRGTPDVRVDEYGVEWALDPSIVYLNHGSFGACPRAVLDEQFRLREELENEPVTFLERRLPDRLEAVRELLAATLGCRSEGLVFVPNATFGVNAVLGSLQLEPGDEIVVTDHEYPACRNAADHFAARAGARVVTAPVPFPLEDPGQVVEAVVGAVGPRTRLVLVDHVTSPTGLVMPIEEIVREVQDGRGVDVLVDGAHAPGMLTLDLDGLGVAYYTGNCHKWLCSPKGSAILYVRADRREQTRPPVISHGATLRPAGVSRFHAEFDWTGTFDPTAVLAVRKAVEVLSGLLPGGLVRLAGRNHELVLAARERLCGALEIGLPAPERMTGSLAAIPLGEGTWDEPANDPLRDALYQRHGIEVFVQRWPRPGLRILRISAQAYNTLEDYERLLGALEREGVVG